MLADFVQRLRKKHGLTQEQVARGIGITRPTYIQFERGVRDLTIAEAQKLAETFNISFEDFVREQEPGAPDVTIEKGKTRPSPDRQELRISVPQKRVDKFREVLRYILKKVGGKPNVGMTVLYKLLYFIDFDYYEKHEEQLMGLVYLKNHHGPTPLLFDKLIAKMMEGGEVEKIKSKFYAYPQIKYLINPAVVPDLSLLNGREIEHIDWELQRLSDMTASELSDLSHKDVPWISAESDTPLDYESVFYRTPETSVRDYGTESD